MATKLIDRDDLLAHKVGKANYSVLIPREDGAYELVGAFSNSGSAMSSERFDQAVGSFYAYVLMDDENAICVERQDISDIIEASEIEL
jgi:hypothetical protein